MLPTKPITPNFFKQIISQIIRAAAKLPMGISSARKNLRRGRVFAKHEDWLKNLFPMRMIVARKAFCTAIFDNVKDLNPQYHRTRNFGFAR
jgi:hypothetical protein